MALMIIFIVFPGCGAVVKRSPGVRYNMPGTGQHFSGYMGIKFRLMNVLEWGLYREG